jgi:hypothetical protein
MSDMSHVVAADDDPEARTIVERVLTKVLRKPFQPSELRDAVQDALTHRRGEADPGPSTTAGGS